MTIALVVVVSIAGVTLYRSSTNIAQNYRRSALESASSGVVVLEHNAPRFRVEEDTRKRFEGGVTSDSVVYEQDEVPRRGRIYRTPERALNPIEVLVHLTHTKTIRDGQKHAPLQKDERNRLLNSRIEDFPAFTHVGTEEEGPNGVIARQVEWERVVNVHGRSVTEEHVGWLITYQPEPAAAEWIVPAIAETSQQSMLRIVLVVMIIVVLVGAGVALWAGSQIVSPINDIIEDIRRISKGDLQHKTRVRGGGEIELLGRTIDRMTRELQEAQDAELELGIREQEMEFAEGVREALLPIATPMIDGFDVGAAHLSGHFGGDFHDFVELPDGRLGLLVCDVSGKGVPAALIGATARAYLRRTLGEGGDVTAALRAVNHELERDVRRGMFVTALYALLDPKTARVQVACAGHKVPLLRYTAADKKLRLVQPDGIALGFDKGPVFDRRLELAEFDLEPGDRLLLSNSGPIRIENPDGLELGEKPFFACMVRAVGLPTPKFLRSIRKALTDYAGEAGSTADVSLVTVLRER